MDPTFTTALFFVAFVPAFWAGLRLVPGRVGRKTFFFGVLAVTLIGWGVLADTAAFPTPAVAVGVSAATALVTGLATGALAGAFARFLRRGPGFAWVALVPFALPIMALMSEARSERCA